MMEFRCSDEAELAAIAESINMDPGMKERLLGDAMSAFQPADTGESSKKKATGKMAPRKVLEDWPWSLRGFVRSFTHVVLRSNCIHLHRTTNGS